MNIHAGANKKKLLELRDLLKINGISGVADTLPSMHLCKKSLQSDTFSGLCPGLDISTLDVDSYDVLGVIPGQRRKLNCLQSGFLFDVFYINIIEAQMKPNKQHHKHNKSQQRRIRTKIALVR